MRFILLGQLRAAQYPPVGISRLTELRYGIFDAPVVATSLFLLLF